MDITWFTIMGLIFAFFHVGVLALYIPLSLNSWTLLFLIASWVEYVDFQHFDAAFSFAISSSLSGGSLLDEPEKI